MIELHGEVKDGIAQLFDLSLLKKSLTNSFAYLRGVPNMGVV